MMLYVPYYFYYEYCFFCLIGLFAKAIAQSGTALNNWAFTESHLDRAFKLGEALGFYTDDKQALLEFFYKTPPLMFAEKQDSIMTHEVINDFLFS